MIPFWGIRLFYLLPIEPLNVSSVINIPLKKSSSYTENSRLLQQGLRLLLMKDYERAGSIQRYS